MIDKGVAIRYGDVAVGAKENFVPTSSEKQFDTLNQLLEYNSIFPNYANPCELYQTLLDGNRKPLPKDTNEANLGLWSVQTSGLSGFFYPDITLTLTAEGQYTSQGFTITFDVENNIYCTSMTITWYRNGNQIETAGFAPNSPFYFCSKKVENFDKVVFTFKKLNMPQNRLKVHAIDFGYGTIFYGNELRSVKVIQELNPISSEITINTTDFTLDSKTDIDYSFQTKQQLSTYFNGKLISTTFIKSAKRKSKNIWEVQTEDYIGSMDSTTFVGGIYENANAVDLLETIFNVAGVMYDISESFNTATVSGYIPYTTCREALMQVAFAIQAVVDTSNSDKVKVFALGNTITQTVPLNRIMQGQSFTDEETVTSVEVAYHKYIPTSETMDAYSAESDGTGNNIQVIFSEPLHGLTITNGSIVTSATNYAVINASENCVLTGKKYNHSMQYKTKNNPVVLASDTQNVVAIENATLVSNSNVDNVLQKCYNYLIKTNTTNLKIVDGKHEVLGAQIKYGSEKYGTFYYGGREESQITYDVPVNVGDCISAETEYLGNVSGNVIKETYTLNGNTIVKDAELK